MWYGETSQTLQLLMLLQGKTVRKIIQIQITKYQQLKVHFNHEVMIDLPLANSDCHSLLLY